MLTRREELILLAVGNLRDDAYLVEIRKYLADLSGKEWAVSTIHIPLRRLEQAGFVDAFYGEATAVRGGRRKKIYRLTERGMTALDETRRMNDKLWPGFPDFEYR